MSGSLDRIRTDCHASQQRSRARRQQEPKPSTLDAWLTLLFVVLLTVLLWAALAGTAFVLGLLVGLWTT